MANTANIGVHILFDHEAALASHDRLADAFKEQIDDAAALGIQSIRFGADWRGFQGDGPDTYNYWYSGLVVEIVAYAKEKGLDVVMLFAQTPDWAVADGADLGATGEGARWQKPAESHDYANAIAELYGRVADAGLSDAVKGWEVWNEPNTVTFWPDAELREGTCVLADTAAAPDTSICSMPPTML